MKDKLLKHWQTVQSFKYINLVYISLFLITVAVLWSKIVALFKSPDDSKKEGEAISKKNIDNLNAKKITPDGYFITGAGVKTKYNISQAREHAERLSALLNTYKGAKWYSVTLSFFGFGYIEKIKLILNPNYPYYYRRYVIDTYRDVYTNYRSLQTDTHNALTGFAGSSSWTNDLTKYFQ